jgi:uncharacterized protein
MELRSLQGGELRAESGNSISGYAAVFGVFARIGNYLERIMAGAFRNAVNGDVRCLFNHQQSNLLGRTPQTLQLEEDQTGLRFTCQLPNTALGSDIHKMIARGDLTQCSFSFDVERDNWTNQTVSGRSEQVRTLESIRTLFDVGPCTFPAYSATSVSARSQAYRPTSSGIYVRAIERGVVTAAERARLIRRLAGY